MWSEGSIFKDIIFLGHIAYIFGPRGASSLFSLERLAFRLFVCVSDDYSHSPLWIVMKFRINVRGSKAERIICKHILYLSRYKMAAVLWEFFAVMVQRFC